MTGKEKCRFLRKIREKIARKIGLSISQEPCTYEGPCSGTCPKCDQEAQRLNEQLTGNCGSSIAGETLNREISDVFSGMKEMERRLFEHDEIMGDIQMNSPVDFWFDEFEDDTAQEERAQAEEYLSELMKEAAERNGGAPDPEEWL